MARNITCDKCGDAFPHVTECPECIGEQCSRCRGKGTLSDPNEGNGFALEGEVEGRNIKFLVSVSQFQADRPDLCGRCLPGVFLEILKQAVKNPVFYKEEDSER